MSSALLNRLTALEKEIKEIKKEISKEASKRPTKVVKPKSIDQCKKIEEIGKFKLVEIKTWLSENDIDVKDIDNCYKDDLIKIVWKNIKKHDESDENDETDENDAGDGYEWYYY
jgi:hypothetical protein